MKMNLRVLFLMPVIECLKLNFRPKLLLTGYSETKFKGLGVFLHLLEEFSLGNFVKLMRYRAFNFPKYFHTSCERNERFVVDMIQGIKPASIVNELLSLRLLIKSAGTLKTLFENPSLIEEYRITNRHYKLKKLPVGEVAQLLAFIVKKQYRKVYSETFYKSFYRNNPEWPNVINLENWEFFDFLFFRQRALSESTLQELFSLLLRKMEEKDNFALLRLNGLRSIFSNDENFKKIFNGPIKKLFTTGDKMQKIIITLGDCLESIDACNFKTSPTLNFRPKLSFAEMIDELYHCLKELLRNKHDSSPAFLLELLAMTTPLNTEEMIFKLLEDIVMNYPPQKISPHHFYYALSYFPKVAKDFWVIRNNNNNSNNKFGREWKRLFYDGAYRYYFPKTTLASDEFLDSWRVDNCESIIANPGTISQIFTAKEIGGVFRIIRGHYRFYCDESYNDQLTRSFVKNGLTLAAFGEWNEFFGLLPRKLLKQIKRELEYEKTGPPLGYQFQFGQEFIADVCLAGKALHESMKSLVKAFLENIKRMDFPMQEYMILTSERVLS